MKYIWRVFYSNPSDENLSIEDRIWVFKYKLECIEVKGNHVCHAKKVLLKPQPIFCIVKNGLDRLKITLGI